MAYTPGSIVDLISTDVKTEQAFLDSTRNVLEALPEAEHTIGGTGKRALNFFNRKTGGAHIIMPSGSKPDDWFKWLNDSFGFSGDPSKFAIGTAQHAKNELTLERALQEHALGGVKDNSRMKLFKQAYEDQITHVKSLKQTLSEARNFALTAAHDMFPKITAELEGLTNAFTHGTVSGASFASAGDLQTALNAVNPKAGPLVSLEGKNLVAKLVNPDTGKLESHILGELNKPLRVNGMTNAIAEHQRILVAAPSQYVDSLTKGITEIEGKLAKSEALVDKVGAEVFKKPSAFTAVAPTASTGTAVTEATEGLMKTKDGSKLATNLEKQHIKTNSFGVVGAEEAGIWDKIKANVMVEKNELQNGVVTAIERGTAGKIFRGGTIAASVGAFVFGIKGLVSGKTDENGQSVPADSGDLIKNGALVVGGAAGVALLALSGNKAKGVVTV